jgi:hypothetical protein
MASVDHDLDMEEEELDEELGEEQDEELDEEMDEEMGEELDEEQDEEGSAESGPRMMDLAEDNAYQFVPVERPVEKTYGRPRLELLPTNVLLLIMSHLGFFEKMAIRKVRHRRSTLLLY